MSTQTEREWLVVTAGARLLLDALDSRDARIAVLRATPMGDILPDILDRYVERIGAAFQPEWRKWAAEARAVLGEGEKP